ncbi:putative peptidoglycan binding protein [Hasllibacter halocynthiae]|uniref:Putative peptidoglycan binding protein n=1 Tax=Hasllibacter halocynthiae TaxID=595589 RepID=A0A2T0X3Q2_9RHOB|nr:peptidoglycan-binding protein [Hasllibacter halocynthiae]PRY93568.1 putative peptidoglycan binding protein [Hasllibacter halocynthiae]
MIRLALVLLALVMAQHAAAQDRAAVLLIGAEERDADFGDIAFEVLRLQRVLEARGMAVTALVNPAKPELERAALRFAEAAGRADRASVVALGRFVTTGPDRWLLPTAAGVPTSLGEAQETGLAMAPLRAAVLAGAEPGMLILGHEEGTGRPGSLLSYGTGTLPAGAEVPTALLSADEVGGVILRALRGDGTLGAQDVRAAGGRASGLPPEGIALAGSTVPNAAAREADAWTRASAAGTEAAYLTFLRDHPSGRFAAEARARLAALRADPTSRAEAAETALALDPGARREVQSDLVVLGFDTRGIDGVFGPGTRAAIRAWQRGRGLERTGFLDAPQLLALGRAADAERARRASEDARLWADTPATEAGYRAYLARFPEGRFAAEAREALERLERAAGEGAFFDEMTALGTIDALMRFLERYPEGELARRAERSLRALEAAEGVSRAEGLAWRRAARADTVAAYGAYLARFGEEGFFAADARAAIARLGGRDDGPVIQPPPLAPQLPDPAEERAAAGEEALGLDAIARRLIELRLAQEGFDPGSVDGSFDGAARAAIAAWQRAQGRTGTGYVSQGDLAGAILDALR